MNAAITTTTYKYKRHRKKVKPGYVIFMICMIALVCFCALPLCALVCRALMPLDELYVYPPRLFVRNPTFQNFKDLLTSLSSSDVPFTRYIFNSLLVTVAAVGGTILICSAGGYGLSKFHPRGSKTIFLVITSALMFSAYVTQIPSYLIVVNLGLVNTYWALIIPKLATSYNFFLIKQFSDQLPDELIDSARMDGANEFTTWWKIAMPLLKPAWSTIAVLSFISNWNDYFSALIYITKDAMKTLPLALQTMSGGAGTVARNGATAAASLLTTLPTIIVFVIMKGRVMQTMTYSGIKS